MKREGEGEGGGQREERGERQEREGFEESETERELYRSEREERGAVVQFGSRKSYPLPLQPLLSSS